MKGIQYGIIYTLIIMIIGLIVIETAAVEFSSIFGLSSITQSFFIGAMRIISLSFVFAGFNIAVQGVFQALDSGAESLAVSVLRQFIFVIPVTALFAKFFYHSEYISWMIWIIFPFAEFLTAIISCILLARTYKQKIKFIDNM